MANFQQKALVEMEMTSEVKSTITLEGPTNSKVKLAKKAIFTEVSSKTPRVSADVV
ncbi:unnamed protein product [marine sediment metagenome]|uniref:Uncharacterized protein n=1 Tax=marine sediment metagenome TaxID=412755 RepID=X1VJV5_9ZZZZ